MIEKVNPSHPDKVADRIAGAIVDLAYKKQENPKIAAEVLIGHGYGHVVIETSVDMEKEDVAFIVDRFAPGILDTGKAMNQGNRGAAYFGKCTNSNSIGIELCCYKKNGKVVPTPTAIKTAAPLVKYLMKKYKVPASHVIRHFDVNGKICPNGYISASSWAKLHKTLTGAKETVYPTATISKGSTGNEVMKLQKCMNKLMKSRIAVDGIFGTNTEKAVKIFQKKYKLEVDGIVGPKTRAKIKYLLK